MITWPSLRSCGGWAPASHHTTLPLIAVELLERAVDSLRRSENVVDFLDVNAIRDQRPFEIDEGPLLQATLAGEFLDIEEVP